MRKLTYANVVATLALFIALGGSSYATFKITGKDVKNGSLTGKDIKRGSLTGTDIKKASLTGTQLKTHSISLNRLKGKIASPVPQPMAVSNVAARPRGGSITSGDPNSLVPYPLTGNTWAQAANETDVVVATVDYQASCTSGIVRLAIDGADVGYLSIPKGTGTAPLTTTAANTVALPDPGSPTTRSITATLGEDTTGGCGAGAVTANNLKITVFRFS
jgi:hypothetical protein